MALRYNMADAKPRPSSPLLPAFGIRDLNEPPSSLGVVHISRRQYDSTIHSQPDATLSYVDLDDGEVITVGTSFELAQRLDDPVSHAAYNDRSPVPAWPAYTNAMEESQNKMHIFDIRRTSGSLAVWRDHEAYSSKSLRKQDTSSPSTTSRSCSPHAAASSSSGLQSTTNTSVSPPTQKEDDLSAALSKLQIVDASAEKSTSSKPIAPQLVKDEAPALLDNALNDLFNGLQSHIGPLADFLESTAHRLRKIADKTRDADTTPVENILNGFKNIVTEVGGLGLEFLAKLEKELEKNRDSGVPEATTEPKSEQTPPVPAPRPTAETKPQFAESAVKKVTFIDLTESPVLPPSNPQPAAESTAKKATFSDLTSPSLPATKLKPTSFGSLKRAGYLPEPWTLPPTSARAPLVTRAPRPNLALDNPPAFAKPSLMTTFAQHPRLDVPKGSIIDSQPFDSDVLVRYPPLPSLRKAASIGGLHAKSEAATRYQPGTSTTSALSRYPSIGQFEHQARIKSRDDSKPKPKDAKLDWYFSPRPKKTDVYKKPTVEDVEEDAVQRPASLAAKSRNTLAEIKDYLANVEDETAKARNTLKTRPASWYSSPLPGAWPEPKMEEWHASVPNSTATTTKPSAATPPPTGVSEQVAGGLSSRISSPPSETYNRAPIFPRKSQTVSGTNPAARLNGPFDPLAHIPVLQPRPQRSQPDLSASKTTSSGSKLEPPVLPGAFPRRSHTVHHTERYKPRDAAPHPYSRPSLWENYVKNSHSTNSVPLQPSYTPPWSCYPESAKPFDNFPTPVPFTHQRADGSIRPVQSMGGLSQKAKLSYPVAPPPPAPASAPAPQQFPTPDKPATAAAKPVAVNNVFAPSPKAVAFAPVSNMSVYEESEAILAKPAAVQSAFAPSPKSVAFAPVSNMSIFGNISPPSAIQPLNAPPSGRVSRSPSILSPCPPAFTQPRGRSGASLPTPFASKGVDECVRQLKAMGFGSDPNELARLNVYAGAAAGDVEAAIEMIEEDREAARELDSQISQVGSIRDVERDFDAEENPWED